MASFEFYSYGHKNVRSTHKTTIEFTKEFNLSLKGDCILAVGATCGLEELPDTLKEKMKDSNQKITVKLEVNKLTEEISGYGDPRLTFSDHYAIIIRKSSFICSRTLMINADKAAIDISREIVENLQNPNNCVKITIQVD